MWYAKQKELAVVKRTLPSKVESMLQKLNYIYVMTHKNKDWYQRAAKQIGIQYIKRTGKKKNWYPVVAK